MKSKLLLMVVALTMLSTLTTNAQDIITKLDGTEIEASVTEITDTHVRFYRYDTNNPLYVLAKSDIFMIKYENGTKDVFNQTTQPATDTQQTTYSQPMYVGQSATQQPSQYTYVTTTNPNQPTLKRHQFGLDFSLGYFAVYNYSGLGDWLGLRWLLNINDNLGWNILNFKFGGGSNSTEAAISVQFMTGIHYKINKLYLDANFGVGSVAEAYIDGSSIADGGAAFEFGVGGYITKKFFMGGYFNINTFGESAYFDYPAMSFGLRIGFDF